MGLQMTLPKEKNGLYHDFTDAYWAIIDLVYSPADVSFHLNAFPSREAKLKDRSIQSNPSVGFGTGPGVVESTLYSWHAQLPVDMVFPNGIPQGRDAQYTVVYNFIKQYTGLPFTDVLEE